ncbi:hypothetical protein EGR_02989 [Echinococcus granulosus]|uniref:Uncharacterized protein n=2 Tax=Echinococcus granulosus TaxID=6210 RepID=W6UV28_ECHGR|nr:hypothetical protein EGR_02989 [Echinococcus granulosus]EUB62237.1 hypothetical protein EGR_02989 [Echinococcus granulosus]
MTCPLQIGIYSETKSSGIIKSYEPMRSLHSAEISSASDIGVRMKDLSERIQEEIVNELKSKNIEKVEPTDYRSTTTVDFHRTSTLPQSKSGNWSVLDLWDEEPATFWTDNYSDVTGITQRSAGVKPFRKCSNFSRSIGRKTDAT